MKQIYLNLPDFVAQSNRYHVIIGTPKEMVQYRNSDVFDLNKIHSAVFDDADMVAASKAVQSNIINPIPPICQQIYVSSVKLRTDLPHQIELNLLDDSVYPQNIDDFFITTENDNKKYKIVRELCKKTSAAKRGQILLFFTVRMTRVFNTLPNYYVNISR